MPMTARRLQPKLPVVASLLVFARVGRELVSAPMADHLRTEPALGLIHLIRRARAKARTSLGLQADLPDAKARRETAKGKMGSRNDAVNHPIRTVAQLPALPDLIVALNLVGEEDVAKDIHLLAVLRRLDVKVPRLATFI